MLNIGLKEKQHHFIMGTQPLFDHKFDYILSRTAVDRTSGVHSRLALERKRLPHKLKTKLPLELCCTFLGVLSF